MTYNTDNVEFFQAVYLDSPAIGMHPGQTVTGSTKPLRVRKRGIVRVAPVAGCMFLSSCPLYYGKSHCGVKLI